MSGTLFTFLLLELVAICWFDLKTRKISNRWPLLNLLFYILLLAFYPQDYPLEWEAFRPPLFFFGGGYGLYLAGVMGAGDVKYLTSYLLLIPPAFHGEALLCLLYATMFVGFVLLLIRGGKNFDKIVLSTLHREWGWLKGIWGKKIAYSPVILVSFVWLGIKSF